jgi:hypothetical protein
MSGVWRFLMPGFLGACLGGQPAAPDAGPPSRLFDPSLYSSPSGEPLAFGVRDEAIVNYFERQGSVSAHLLTRSGEHPRLIAAFPANNQGIGVWFSPVPNGAALSLGVTADSEPEARGGELTPVVRAGAERPLHGVRATLVSSATELSTELVLLGNVRTLRDYGYGVCLEDKEEFPALRNESIELDPDRGTLRIRRVQIGGAYSMELLLAARSGTTLSLRPRTEAARAACPLRGDGQPILVIRGEDGIALDVIALADDEPLTPIAPGELFAQPPDAGTALSALAFLSYDEKLLAGSWRFLTYFGRDTLLSLWLLMPSLQNRVAEAALGSVLERVQLTSGVPRPEGGIVDVGDVAHEEALGDYAAYENAKLEPPPADLRQPRLDYKMIDDDFLLPPLLGLLMDQLGSAASAEFLARRRSDGRSFEEAALANLELVSGRARPFADDARAPSEKAAQLVALHDGLSVGQWRDSDMGLAYGRYPFDVNAGLVPGALDAAASVYSRLGRSAEAAEARRLRAAWSGIEELYRITLPLATAEANVASYAASVGVGDTSSALSPEAGAPEAGAPGAGDNVVEYGIALDASLRPLPVMHSDHGFVLAFAEPTEAYLDHVAELLLRPFPAGLMSPVGMMVANPALADAAERVLVPGNLADPSDDVQTPLRDLFTAAHYHGTVVWSWQQALLAKGLRRQLLRADLADTTRGLLETAECQLWRAIDATRAQSTSELWSWAPNSAGQPEMRPFGSGQGDPDESNAIQLWSTVYLAVQEPTPAENPRCGAAGVGP